MVKWHIICDQGIVQKTFYRNIILFSRDSNTLLCAKAYKALRLLQTDNSKRENIINIKWTTLNIADKVT